MKTMMRRRASQGRGERGGGRMKKDNKAAERMERLLPAPETILTLFLLFS